MPTPPTVTETLRIRLKYGMPSGTLAGSRFYLQYSGSSPTGANCATLATGISGAFGTHLAPLLTDNGAMEEVDVLDLNSVSGASGTNASSVGGTRSGSNMPQQVAAILEFAIARRYRGGKPKMYTPFGVQSDTTDELIDWTTAFQTSMIDGWNAFITEVLALGIGSASLVGQVNVGYYSGFTVVTNPVTGRARNAPKYKSGPITPDAIINVGMRTLFGSQKRRRSSTSP